LAKSIHDDIVFARTQGEDSRSIPTCISNRATLLYHPSWKLEYSDGCISAFRWNLVSSLGWGEIRFFNGIVRALDDCQGWCSSFNSSGLGGMTQVSSFCSASCAWPIILPPARSLSIKANSVPRYWTSHISLSGCVIPSNVNVVGGVLHCI